MGKEDPFSRYMLCVVGVVIDLFEVQQNTIFIYSKDRTPPINAQSRSKSWHWSEMSLNADQFRSRGMVTKVLTSGSSTGIDRHWSALIGIDRNWSELIGIDRHWSELIDIGINARILIGIDRHWALIKGVLKRIYSANTLSKNVSRELLPRDSTVILCAFCLGKNFLDIVSHLSLLIMVTLAICVTTITFINSESVHSDEWNYDLEYINIPNWTKCINAPS